MTEITANPKETYALVVGIEKYGDISVPNVNGPARDAINFAKWLRERGVPKNNIFLSLSSLEDNKDKNEELIDELELHCREATHDNICNLLMHTLCKKEGELLIIFWVGHGIIDSGKKEQRHLLFSNATHNHLSNLYLESLLKSIRSASFKIPHQLCIIDACASFLPGSLCLGGVELGCEEQKTDYKQFVFFSTRKGEKSNLCKERTTSYFCEELQKELNASPKNIWPPQMKSIAENLKTKFEELRKQGKVEQIPNWDIDVNTWDDDQYKLVKKSPSEILASDVKLTSDAAREALNPRYLQRISRLAPADDDDQYLQAIERSVKRDATVIFIYAPAGYGKSVILGEIYDRLIKSNTSWIALTLCAYLSGKPIDSIESLAEVLGESICLRKEPIDEITLRLTDTYGSKGVLLIDTLDLILNNTLIPNLRGVLLKLLKVGVTVVFTCREEEFNFLKSLGASLAGCKVDHHKVKEFSDSEIREAASIFIEKKKEDKIKENKDREIDDRIFNDFANQIFQVAAGEYQASELKKIIKSPLLLGMLCELFSEKGSVSPNLTVSNLYDEYWKEKVAGFRENQTKFDADQKELLCLAIAKSLFEIFREDKRFQESIDKNDLEIDWSNQHFVSARENLVSEGVLEWAGTDRNQIRFFHQTLLEYVLARWLKLREAKLSLNALLNDLKNKDWAYKQLYWYVVIRQLLTIESYEKFKLIFPELDIKEQLPAFRAVVFAAASRDEPSALKELLELRLELDTSHQETLLQAVVSASVKLADPTYEFMVVLMKTGQTQPAINAAKAASSMLAQWWGSLSPRLEETLEAISKREVSHDKNKSSSEDRPVIFGWLLQDIKTILEQNVDTNTLQNLRQYYDLAGQDSQSFLIQLHLNSKVSKYERRELLKLLVQKPVPNKSQIKEDLINLSRNVLLELVETENSIQLNSWLVALDSKLEKLPKGWDEIQGRAVGYLMEKSLDNLNKNM